MASGQQQQVHSSLKMDAAEKLDQASEGPQLRKSCDYCVRMKRGCDGETPCELCKRRKKECVHSVKKRSGPAKGTKYCKRRARKHSKAARWPRCGGATLTTATATRAASTTAASSAARRPLAVSAAPAATTTAAAQASRNFGARIDLSPVSSPAMCIPIVKHEHDTPPVTPPHAAGIINTAHGDALTLIPGGTMDTINSTTVTSPKRELCDVKPPVLAEAAAAAVKASQARWRAQCGGVETGEPVVNDVFNGSLLPFYYPPGGHGPGSTAGYHGGGVGLGDGSGGEAFSGAAVAQLGLDATRMASRRSSVEEALYGSCFKRSSFTTWPQTVDLGGKDAVGLLCHRLHTDGLEDHGGRALSSPETAFPSGLEVNTMQSNGIVGMNRGAQEMLPPIAAPGMPFAEGGVGGGGGTPSLRDLLLDRWSPTPYSEVSMTEGRV